MATVEITWGAIKPVTPADLARGEEWAERHGYTVRKWRDTNASDRPVILTRITAPSGHTVALYETESE